MLLLLREVSPIISTVIPGVVERIPTKSLVKVPEFPKLSLVFFFK